MYAVIETGGKQYRVSQGDVIKVEKLKGEQGSQVAFQKILLLSRNEGIICGTATEGVQVRGTILGEKKGEKISVFKYKKRKNSKRKVGHRQKYLSIRVDEILANSLQG